MDGFFNSESGGLFIAGAFLAKLYGNLNVCPSFLRYAVEKTIRNYWGSAWSRFFNL